MRNLSLTIGWLYPELMSTYGDRGNIFVLQRRCEWRGIKTNIVQIDQKITDYGLRTTNLIFGGGAQDREQEIVIDDLRGKKGVLIKELIEKHVPALFVCGSYQLMGNYYEPEEGKRMEGLKIFDIITTYPEVNKKRLIGNAVAQVHLQNLLKDRDVLPGRPQGCIIAGFENHGGRTFLGMNAKPFARMINGFGNNGEDKTEGVIYKNAIGTYLHGPLLPKNPCIADYLIDKALEVKYKEKFDLTELDDELENEAREAFLKKHKPL